MSRRLPNRTLLRIAIILRRARIPARDSTIVRAMTADLAVVAAAEAVTAVEIAVAVSVEEADAIAEAVHRAGICRHRNMRLRPVGRELRIRRRAVSRRARVKATHRRQPKICRQLFCRANRSQNIGNVRRLCRILQA